MIKLYSIKEYPHRNKISPYIKICGPSVILFMNKCLSLIIFLDLTPFGTKLDLTPFGIKIVQSDVTLPSKIIIVFW